MKTRNILFMLLIAGFFFSNISCLDLFNDDEEEELTPEEAKVEIRSANQEIQAESDALMETPGMVALDYLADLSSNESWKSSLASVLLNSKQITYHKLKDIFITDGQSRAGSDDYLRNPGTYRFNFALDRFELVEPGDDMVKMIYPANEQAYTEQRLNAEFVADNLELTPISYVSEEWDDYSGTWITETVYDTVVTNTDISLKIDEASVMTGSYHSTLASNGNPTAVDISFTMSPYQFIMSLSSSGVNVNTTLSMKLNGEEIMGYSMTMTYSSDMEDIDRIEGSYRIPPVKFEGSIEYGTLTEYMDQANVTETYDIEYMNTLIDLIVYQTELDAELGKVVYRLYTDPDDGEQSPEMAVEYSDGSWEWLDDIMNESGGSKRSGEPWSWCFSF